MNRNDLLYEEARLRMTGGVCAGGRLNAAYGRPMYIRRADGSRLYTVDGEEFIDYHCGAGAVLFGHNHPRLRKAVEDAVAHGFFMNHDSPYTVEFASLFHKLVPGAEKIRLTNSGTEATMAAIRVARGFTGKDIIIKMDGHFHGMHELIWYNHGTFPEMDEFGEVVQTVPDSAGIPMELGNYIKVIRFNDTAAAEHAIAKYKDRVAAILLEPVSFNCGCYEGERDYLRALRELCTKNDILLIFDEVITGLRFRPGSAQAYYGVTPDLSIFAKAVGGGMPIALVAGRGEIMDTFNPLGPVVCSGTSSGSQLAVRVGIECLKMVMEPGFYDRIDETAKTLYGGLSDLFQKYSVPGHIRGMGARFALYFGCEAPEDDTDLRRTMAHYDPALAKRFIKECLEEQLYFHSYGDAPYPAHCGFGLLHTEEDIEITLKRLDRVFSKLKK